MMGEVEGRKKSGDLQKKTLRRREGCGVGWAVEEVDGDVIKQEAVEKNREGYFSGSIFCFLGLRIIKDLFQAFD